MEESAQVAWLAVELTDRGPSAEGTLMPFPRVIPHSDGSGVIDAGR